MCMTSNSTVKNEPSQEQSEAFRFRMNAAQGALGNFAQPGEAPETGTGYFTNPKNSPYHLSPEQQQAIAGVQHAATNLPPDPTSNWAMQAYAPGAKQYWDTASSPINVPDNPYMDQWNAGAGSLGTLVQSPISVGGIDMGAANVDFNATGANYDPVGVGHLAEVDVARIDPTRALQAAQNHLSTISSPAIRAALQAGGMGRSGAEAEGLAQEGVRLQLPIEQQILQAEQQANQLEATIQAHQQEVELLEQQRAALQAQALTAQSREQAQQINGQIAGIEAQIRGNLAAAQFAGQVQASIAQRTSAVQAGTTMLGQLGQMGMQGQALGAQANIAQRQGQMGAGQQILQNLAQMGVAIPGMQSQQYQNALTGAQTNLQAASLPQQMSQQEYENYRNYILSLLGATPLPSQMPGGAQQSSAAPSGAQAIGTAAMIGSMFI